MDVTIRARYDFRPDAIPISRGLSSAADGSRQVRNCQASGLTNSAMTLRLETTIFPGSRILARIEQSAQGVAPGKVCAAWREQHLVEDVVQSFNGSWIVGCRDQEQLIALKKYLATYHSRAYPIIEELPCNPLTIAEIVTVEGRHIRQTSSLGAFGVVQLRFEPSPHGRILALEYLDGDGIPEQVKHYADAILQGLRSGAAEGARFGNPVVGFEVKLLSARYHDVDSSAYSFTKATMLAFAEMLTRNRLIPLQADSGKTNI